MERKAKLGFRFYYHKGNSNSNTEYAHPEFEFYSYQDHNWSRDGWHRSDHSILRVKTQTDREKGHSIWKAYSISADYVSINQESIRVLTAIHKALETNYRNPNRSIVKAIHSLKVERLFYHSDSCQMVPWKYRKNADLWINAFKQGLKLEKERVNP